MNTPRIGRPIPGWPDYTIDDNKVVRSYKTSKTKIIGYKNRDTDNYSIAMFRDKEDGTIERCKVMSGKLYWCAVHNVDPTKVTGTGVFTSDGELVVDGRVEILHRNNEKQKEKAYGEWKRTLTDEVYQRCTKFLQLQYETTLSNNARDLMKELRKWRRRINHLSRSHVIVKDNALMEDCISDSMTMYVERVLKSHQIFPDLISVIASDAGCKYRRFTKRKETHKPDWYWSNII